LNARFATVIRAMAQKKKERKDNLSGKSESGQTANLIKGKIMGAKREDRGVGTRGRKINRPSTHPSLF